MLNHPLIRINEYICLEILPYQVNNRILFMYEYAIKVVITDMKYQADFYRN